MKKIVLNVIKYLFLAVMLGGVLGNLACVVEIGFTRIPYLNIFLIMLTIMVVISSLFVYFLFMKKKKTLYALVCIPCADVFGLSMVNFWWRFFRKPAGANMNFTRAGVYGLLLATTVFDIFIILIMQFIGYKRRLTGHDEEE